MRLPNAEQVIVDREKITECLLNPAHRYRAAKARFFRQFGFELAAWETLAQALREHAQRNEVSKVDENKIKVRLECVNLECGNLLPLWYSATCRRSALLNALSVSEATAATGRRIPKR